MAGMAIALLALGTAGCRERFVPSFSLGGISPGMTEADVLGSLGAPERSAVQPGFLWWFYRGGLTIGLKGESAEATVAWVVQAQGNCSKQIAIGDSKEKVISTIGVGHQVVDDSGRDVARLAGPAGEVGIEFVFKDAILEFVAVHGIPLSDRVPPPDPALFPDLMLRGIRLLMTGPEVVGILGEPPVRERLPCWDSWRYPNLGLVIDMAPVRIEEGSASNIAEDTARVIWAMQTAKQGIPRTGLYSPPEWEGVPAFRDHATVANQDGDTLTFYYDYEDRPVALVLAPGSEVLRRPEVAGTAQADPRQLAGLGLGMTTHEVEATLGEPDRVRAGETYAEWDYFETGLTVVLVQSQHDGYLHVVTVTQRRGAWFTVLMGDTTEETESRLGRALSPGTATEPSGIRYELENGSYFLAAVGDGKVIYFRLSLREDL